MPVGEARTRVTWRGVTNARWKGRRGQALRRRLGEASARQGETGLPEVLLVILLPHVFGADASGSYGCPVGACADASAHSVQGTGTGVLEGCLRCCASGSLAPRRESAPTARQTDLCWSVSSPEHSHVSAPHGEAHPLLFLPARPSSAAHPARSNRHQRRRSASVGWRRSDQLHSERSLAATVLPAGRAEAGRTLSRWHAVPAAGKGTSTPESSTRCSGVLAAS